MTTATIAKHLVFLSHAESDVLVASQLPGLDGFPRVEALPIRRLDAMARRAGGFGSLLRGAGCVVMRVLADWESAGDSVHALRAACAREGIPFAVLPGVDSADASLMAACTVPHDAAAAAHACLRHGGVDNTWRALAHLARSAGLWDGEIDPPTPLPRHGISFRRLLPGQPTVGILAYRANMLSGNTAVHEALADALALQGVGCVGAFTATLQDRGADGLPAGLAALRGCDCIVSFLSYALGSVNPDGPTLAGSPSAFEQLGTPVLQAVVSYGTRREWEESAVGLSPSDVTLKVALPEFDGRVAAPVVGFQETDPSGAWREAPLQDRVDRLAELAAGHARLRATPNAEKRIAIILTNSSSKAVRVGNAVGLDSAASLVHLLRAMAAAGYDVGEPPEDSDALFHALIAACAPETDLPTRAQIRAAAGRIPGSVYRGWLGELPASAREKMVVQWGPPPGEAYRDRDGLVALGLRFGNVLVALQPARGYGVDPQAVYHAPDLPPPHYYLAFYRWLREEFRAHAAVHLGKHGSLEWLPGKGVGLSAACFPDSLLGGLPLFYPFIINDPGEGTQAKRRAHAVIVDHLTPPLASAGLHGALAELAQLVDEHFQLEHTDPSKLPGLRRRMWELCQESDLSDDVRALLRAPHALSRQVAAGAHLHVHKWVPMAGTEGLPIELSALQASDAAHLVQELDAHLCDLAGAQIRSGLHILSQPPTGRAEAELLLHLTKLPQGGAPGLRAAVAAATPSDAPTAAAGAEAVDAAALVALEHVAAADAGAESLQRVETAIAAAGLRPTPDLRAALRFAAAEVLPRVRACIREIPALLHGLDGGFVPAGPSGAPSRGLAHVLPTGKNFYSADPRAMPSMAAWETGQRLAESLIARKVADTGVLPRRVGLTLWGTSAMRTHGDDIAEALALMGIRPLWQPENHRVAGLEPIPLSELGRPRIDVLCRISGLFRDAFPHAVALLAEAAALAAALDEPLDQNFVRASVEARRLELATAGLDPAAAALRVFGNAPGSYGAGMMQLVDGQNWTSSDDFAQVYIEWGGHGFGVDGARDARAEFRSALAGVDTAAKSQDNREHDILDSDDYFQFIGGMSAAVASVSGRAPDLYVADSSDPTAPQTRGLDEELRRVFHTRVVNPKWIDGMRRHGYRGGLEMAATVDYLFGFGATTDAVPDWMYRRAAEAYVLDAENRAFLEQSNPWSLAAMAERLVEAARRGMWRSPDPALLAAIEAVALDTDARVEGAVG